MTALTTLAIFLGIVQLLPIPAGLVERVSPRSLAVNSYGMIPEKGLADDPSAELPAPFLARSPISLDRPATLRWILGAIVCLGVFVVSSHYSVQLRKSKVIWGSVVAAFFVNVVFGVVQVSSHSSGLYGMFTPGSAPAWGPNLDDAMSAPTVTVLRPLGESKVSHASLAGSRPDQPFLMGSLMGGPGAFLALGSLAFPLGFGLMLQMMAPRGHREGLMLRLRNSGQGSLVLLMLGLLLAGAVLIGVSGRPLARLDVRLRGPASGSAWHMVVGFP